MQSIKSGIRWTSIVGALVLSACAGEAMDEQAADLELAADEEDEDEIGTIGAALGDCTSATLTISPSSPQDEGTDIYLSATSTGCSEPKHVWQVRQDGGNWVTIAKTKEVSSYGPISYPQGVYEFRVKVKDKSDGGPAAKSVQTFEWTGCVGWNCYDLSGNTGCEEDCADQGLGSFCAFVVEGGSTCVADNYCNTAPACGTSADCPSGYVCTVNTCCEVNGYGNRCFLAECPGEAADMAPLLDGATGAMPE